MQTLEGIDDQLAVHPGAEWIDIRRKETVAQLCRGVEQMMGPMRKQLVKQLEEEMLVLEARGRWKVCAHAVG